MRREVVLEEAAEDIERARDLHTRTPHQAPAMKDPIVQEVRDARAAVAADFGFDLHKFFAWAKTHTAAERKAKHWLPTNPDKTPDTPVGASVPPVTRKRRVRAARV